MNIPEPEIYFGKKIKVILVNAPPIVGELYGYDYDFDDDGNEYLEFDVENEIGLVASLTEDEIDSIEVLTKKRKNREE